MKFRILVAMGLCVGLVVSLVVMPPSVRGVSSTVVISEFRTRGPNGGNDEFVEIYNVSGAAVDISGWKLRASNSAGTVGTRSTVPSGTMLNPGCHFLFINTNASAGPFSGGVAGNATYGVGIADDGGLAVTMPNDSVVDAAGMSAGSALKEGMILAQLTTNVNRSYERKPGGASGSGTDTDNNAADFMVIAPSDPQNLASPCINTGTTDPSGTGSAFPASVQAGDSTLLRVVVTPGTGPASTGLAVRADLTAIGGSATQQFFDDGMNGDQTPSDNTFSFLATVAAGTAPGPKSLAVTITDAESRSGSTSISLTVAPPLSAIHEVQGAGATSPLVGQLVRVRGIVTGIKGNGFFLQEPDANADGDVATSEGIFIFVGMTPGGIVAMGNHVEVTGNVQEFSPAPDPNSPPITEISMPMVTLISTGNALPMAIVLSATDTDPAGLIDKLEKYEFMRVHVNSLTVIAPTDGFVTESSAMGNTNGVFYGVITGVARPFREPGIDRNDPLPAGSPCCVPRFDTNPERLRVDSDGQVGVTPLPAPIEVTSGAVVTNLIGPLDYSFRTYTILPDSTPALSGNVTATAVPLAGTNEFTVASANLERFFDTVNDPGISDVALTPAAFANRLNKMSLAVRNVMQTPDVIGVVEVENIATLQALADKINNDAVAAGGANPNYQAYLEEGNDPGGIDVGLLVKSARVVVTSVTQEGKLATYIDPNSGLPATLNDRPPLVLQATVLSMVGPNLAVTVIVNHLRSLIDVEDPVDGNRVRTKRAAQAEFLANLVQARQIGDPNETIILVGDFNAFQFNDGYADLIGTIKGTPTAATDVVKASPDLVDPDLTDLIDTIPAAEGYSFSFDGSAQALDHVLVNGVALGRVSRFFYARNNADFPESYRGDSMRPERYSDHDAPVAYFSLPPISVMIDIKPGEFPNSINLGSNGNVPVAILSTADFDAGMIDPVTVTLAGAGAKLKGKGTAMASLTDVNGDGLRDLVIHIQTSALQLSSGDVQAVLEGMTFDGKFIRGADTVRIVPQ